MKKDLVIVVLCLFILFIVFLFVSAESYFRPYPYIDTKFTEQFSWEKYNQISKGMTADQVRQILGEPFRLFESVGGNLDIKSGEYDSGEQMTAAVLGPCWQYSEDGGPYSFSDFAWISVNVCFDELGKVKNKNEVIFYD